MTLSVVMVFSGAAISLEETEQEWDLNPVLSGKYLGQKPPGLVPEIFAPDIVSTEAFEFSGSFTPDGKEFIFTRRAEIGKPGNRLLYLKEEDGMWTKPQLAPFAENCIEFEPSFSPDGKLVFFNSERAHPETGERMVNDEKIWFSEKTKSGWGKAKYLEGIINTGWIMNPSVTLDGTMYFFGQIEGEGDIGILKSKLDDGKYKTVEPFINGAHPFISPQENYIIFDRQGKSWEETELYISFKTENETWTEPKKIGNEINSTKTEAYAFVTTDGKYLFFNRGGDIYWVDAIILEPYLK